jgi:hypothetical protein
LQGKRSLEGKRFRHTLCYKLVIVMYIKPTTIYKTMKLIKHPNDRLFLVRLFIMLLLIYVLRITLYTNNLWNGFKKMKRLSY